MRGQLVATLQDLIQGVRLLRRNVGPSLLAIGVLALGIGLCAAVFSVVAAVVFRPIEVGQPKELVYLYHVTAPGRLGLLPFKDINSLASFYGPAFSGFTAHWGAKMTLAIDGETAPVQAEAVTASYFEVLGVAPMLGRAFFPDEDQVDRGEYPVVISHQLWRDRFKQDPLILGRTVRVNGRIFTVAGVMKPRFVGLSDILRPSQLWVLASRLSDTEFGMGLIARLRPGISLSQAQAIVSAQSVPLQESWRARWGYYLARGKDGRLFPHTVVRATDVQMPFDPNARVIPLGLLASISVTVLIVLCLAVMNAATVVASRAVARSSELAVRQALGADATRIVRQLLTESVVLSLCASGAAWCVAWVATRAYRIFAPNQLAFEISLDLRVLFFTLVVCVCAGMAVGIAPALQTRRIGIVNELVGGSGVSSVGRRRFRYLVLIPQIALSAALLVVASVHALSLRDVESSKNKYQIDDIAVLRVGRWDRISSSLDANRAKAAERAREFFRRVSTAVGAGSGSVAMTSRLPVYSQESPTTFIGRKALGGRDQVEADYVQVSSGYFRTIGLTLKQGRDFHDGDTLNGRRVAVVSETFARQMWPAGDVVGQEVALFDSVPRGEPSWIEIVGVAGDADPILDVGGPRPAVYTPLMQSWQPTGMLVVARSTSSAMSVGRLKDAIVGADSFAEVRDTRTFRSIIDELLYPRRVAAGVLAICGVVGVLLAGVGLYGAASNAVAKRLREIGVRLTVGAKRGDVLRLVLSESTVAVAFGAAPGMLLGCVGLWLTSSQIVGAPTFDWLAFVLVPLTILGVVAGATFVPVRRALSIDPASILRNP